MSVVYGVGLMPPVKLTYSPIGRDVVPVWPVFAVSTRATKSLQPSPPSSALSRQFTFDGPPVRRFEIPCVYSCAITPLSRSLSRSGDVFFAVTLTGKLD